MHQFTRNSQTTLFLKLSMMLLPLSHFRSATPAREKQSCGTLSTGSKKIAGHILFTTSMLLSDRERQRLRKHWQIISVITTILRRSRSLQHSFSRGRPKAGVTRGLSSQRLPTRLPRTYHQLQHISRKPPVTLQSLKRIFLFRCVRSSLILCAKLVLSGSNLDKQPVIGPD